MMNPARVHCAGARLAAALLGLALGVGLAGCRTPSSEAAAPVEADVARLNGAVPLLRSEVPLAETLDETPLRVSELTPERAPDVKEHFVFPDRPDAGQGTRPVGEYPEKLIKGMKGADEVVQVKFNFDAAPLTEIVPLFATLLSFSYLVDPSVKGAVTMTIDSEMKAREVWDMFEHVLWLAGAYASRNAGFIHILPFNKMPQERRLLAGHEPLANVEVMLIPIFYSKSAELAGLLQPFITPGATLTALPNYNSLLMVEAPANVPKLLEIIKLLDNRGEAAWPHIALRCQQVDVETVQADLESILPVIGLAVTRSTPSGGAVKIASLPRLQVIVASAALREVLDEVERWVRMLDQQDTAEQENVYFYNVRHSTSEHLSEALSVFFDQSTTRARKVSASKSTSAKATAAGAATPATPQTPRSPAASPSEPGESQSVFDTPLVVFADGDQNRLTLRTTQRAYTMVRALLERLDVPPRQVVISAIVADITLGKSTEFGVSYAALDYYKDYTAKHAMINALTSTGATFPQPKAVSSGLALLFEKNEDTLGFLRAVAGRSNVRVLSAPQITATSDQEAVINIGDRVPIITGDYSDVSGTTATDTTIHRNIEYQDTGVILTVTPHVTAGNEVRLDVTQEVSDAVKTESSDIDSPTIRSRKLATTLVVPDGSTALLGGLIRTRGEKSYSGVPLLMDLPLVGAAFRTNEISQERTELLVLITVNVVTNESAIESLANRYRTALEAINRELAP